MSTHADHAGPSTVEIPAPVFSTGCPKQNPTGIRPGTLVYLWAPGDDKPGGDRILVRVERTTTDTIVGKDLGSAVRGKYQVGGYPAGFQWTWEVAAEPEHASGIEGVSACDRQEMTFEERRVAMFGDVGQLLTFHMAGGSSVSGIVTKVIYDGEKPWFIVVSSPKDSMRSFQARLKVDQIAQIMEVAGA